MAPNHMSRLETRLHGKKLPAHQAYYLLFDEAQDSYWDYDLWNEYLKTIQGSGSNAHVILFCSYGSPALMPNVYNGGTPLSIEPDARVSLQPSGPNDVGLLLTPLPNTTKSFGSLRSPLCSMMTSKTRYTDGPQATSASLKAFCDTWCPYTETKYERE